MLPQIKPFLEESKEYMAKQAKMQLPDVLEAIDMMEIEDLAQVKTAASDKIDSMKHLVVSQFREDLQKKMALFGLTGADLGFGMPAKGPKKGQGGTRTPKGGACPICEFETAPPHDGRKHRSQGDDKKPFTNEELEMLHMTKV